MSRVDDFAAAAAAASIITRVAELRHLRRRTFLPKVICVAYETVQHTIRKLETGLEAETIRSQVFG